MSESAKSGSVSGSRISSLSGSAAAAWFILDSYDACLSESSFLLDLINDDFP